jgi:hypothetical protein
MFVIPGPAKVAVTSSRHLTICALMRRAMLARRLDLFPCLLREDLGPPAITEQKAHGNCDGGSVNTMGAVFSGSVSRARGRSALLAFLRKKDFVTVSAQQCCERGVEIALGSREQRASEIDFQGFPP